MSAKRKPKKRKEPESYETFIFEVVNWEPSYHLSLNSGTLDDELYWESATIQLSSSCVFPSKFANRRANITIAAKRDLLHPSILEFDKTWKPRCVGVLTASTDTLEFYGSVPLDSFSALASMVASGRFGFVVLHGQEMKYRKSLCTSFSLDRTVNLDDY